MIDIVDFNARWLEAWSEKDVPRLLGFYADDCVYKDTQTAAGLAGHAALGGHLTGLFAAMPPTIYMPEETWAIDGGFCGRWYAAMGPDGMAGRLRGFDLVVLKGDRIALNEVYVHQMPA